MGKSGILALAERCGDVEETIVLQRIPDGRETVRLLGSLEGAKRVHVVFHDQ
jgi:hypothetical protein